MAVEVGRFKLEDGTLSGPADYFASRGGVDAAVDKALNSVTFKYGAAGASPSPEVAFLVALQTDYAAYAGEKDLERWQRIGEGRS